MLQKLRNSYHNASQWTHHHSAVFVLGFTLCAGLFGSIFGSGQTFAATTEAPVTISTGTRYHMEATIDLANNATLTIYDELGTQLQSVSTTLEREYEMLVIAMGEDDGVGYPGSYMRDLEIQYDSDNDDMIDTTLSNLFESELNRESTNIGPGITIDTQSGMLYTDYGFLLYHEGPIFNNSISFSWDFMAGSELTADSHLALVDAQANSNIVLIGYTDSGEIIIEEIDMSQEGGEGGGEEEPSGNASGTVDAISVNGLQVSLSGAYTGFIEIQSSIDDSSWDFLQRNYLESDPYSGPVNIGIAPMIDGSYYRVIVFDDQNVISYSNSMQYLAEGENNGGGEGFDCANAPSIMVPIVECQALVDMYTDTQGNSRGQYTNRNTDSNVCNWFGVYCDENNNITEISLSYNNLVGDMDVSGLTSLTHLYAGGNQLTSLDLSDLTNLTQLDLYNNQLTSLDVSDLISLTYLSVDSNQLTSLNLNGLTNLTNLGVYKNQLTSLDLNGLTNLTDLDVDENQLISLDLSDLTNLTSLYAGYNQLISLDLNGLTSLTYLGVYNNQLTSLDVSDLANLAYLYASDNQLTSLDLNGLTNLTDLRISNNDLSGDASTFCNLTQLHTIRIDKNKFEGTIPSCFFEFANLEEEGSQINHNMLDINGLNPMQISFLDQYFYNYEEGEPEDNYDRRDQYSQSDLTITQSITSNYITTLGFTNNGRKSASDVFVYYDKNDGISINSETSYTEKEINKVYGVVGDVCYQNLYENNSGPYRDRLDQWAGGSFIDFLEEELEYAPGISDRGTEYVGDGSDAGKYWIDFTENVQEHGLDGTFIGGMNILGIDITTIEGCGYGGINVYAFDIGDLPVDDTRTITINLSAGIGYNGSYDSTARIVSEDSLSIDENINDNISIETITRESSGNPVGTGDKEKPTRGGGDKSKTSIDNCPNGDFSKSYYDGECGDKKPQVHAAPEIKKKKLIIDDTETFTNEVKRVAQSAKNTYEPELLAAYVFAKDAGITTADDIDSAMLFRELRRDEAAKMASMFAMKTLNMKPDKTKKCEFSDMKTSSVEMQQFAILACQLNIMGMLPDGETPDAVFNPAELVSRMHLGTIISRMLYNGEVKGSDTCRYCEHLTKLKTDGIMTQIDVPTQEELRGYVMTIMMRAYKKGQ